MAQILQKNNLGRILLTLLILCALLFLYQCFGKDKPHKPAEKTDQTCDFDIDEDSPPAKSASGEALPDTKSSPQAPVDMDNILKRLDALEKSRENDGKVARTLEEIQEELDDIRTEVKALVPAEDEKPPSRPVVASREQTPVPDTSKLESRLARMEKEAAGLQAENRKIRSELAASKAVARTPEPAVVKKPAVKKPLILKPRRIYLNQPVKIFDRQILVNLSALNDGVAVFDLTLPPLNYIRWEQVKTGDRRIFYYEKETFFFEMLGNGEEWATITITRQM